MGVDEANAGLQFQVHRQHQQSDTTAARFAPFSATLTATLTATGDRLVEAGLASRAGNRNSALYGETNLDETATLSSDADAQFNIKIHTLKTEMRHISYSMQVAPYSYTG